MRAHDQEQWARSQHTTEVCWARPHPLPHPLPCLQALRPLADPNIWGNYNVTYVSTGQGQGVQPAGGGLFRGGLGKLLFRTTLLAQSVLQPDVVTNKVGGGAFAA